MGLYTDCAEHLYYNIFYSDKDNHNRAERNIENIIETMLLFLNYSDMIEIVTERVIPKLEQRKFKNRELWFDFFNREINFWKECADIE